MREEEEARREARECGDGAGGERGQWVVVRLV